MGVVLNEGFNFVLKHVIKEPRPVSGEQLTKKIYIIKPSTPPPPPLNTPSLHLFLSADVYTHSLFVEYGMPSSHAQFMAFFATYFTLFLFFR